MKSTLVIAENGTILNWNVNGVAVLAPFTKAATVADSRGGLPLCVPMFSTQQREVAGSHVPLHGVLMYEPHGEAVTRSGDAHWHKTFSFLPSERYNWKWCAQLHVTLEQNTLTYSLCITRDRDCTNEHEMPYSLGFHPYFNTLGADFSYEIAGHTTYKQEVPKNIISSTFAPLVQGEHVTLTTSKGILTITPQGYDEYCLWTDRLDEYFCIEPIFQYREYGLQGTGLEKGSSHKTSVTLQFYPNNL